MKPQPTHDDAALEAMELHNKGRMPYSIILTKNGTITHYTEEAFIQFCADMVTVATVQNAKRLAAEAQRELDHGKPNPN